MTLEETQAEQKLSNMASSLFKIALNVFLKNVSIN